MGRKNHNPGYSPQVYNTALVVINYVDGDGNVVAEKHSRQYITGVEVSITSPKVDGMVPDQPVVKIMPGSRGPVKVTYGRERKKQRWGK